jgi:hypothetical protein
MLSGSKFKLLPRPLTFMRASAMEKVKSVSINAMTWIFLIIGPFVYIDPSFRGEQIFII